MNFLSLLTQGDALSIALSLLLLAMSVATWSVILYKAWVLHRASQDMATGKAVYWQARDAQQAQTALRAV
ncbi:MAG: MotA/TolQ/ExbB proton channel family protein, partial [Betaproteobacteria bacterium]|nr:MotA/TolQ/ExbB proton channel family protein [Betaproteobacteria bacterium]